MKEKKIIPVKRKTNAKKKIIAKGITHPISVRPKTTTRRTAIGGKILEKKLFEHTPLRTDEESISQITCQAQKI